MITYRKIDLDAEYPKLSDWWAGHRSLPVPRAMFAGAEGWMAESAGVEIAASFLYLVVGGRSAILEWTSTNPRCAASRDTVAAVKGLYEHLEERARGHGCVAIFSFVKPNSFEERAMVRVGYFTTPDDPGHRVYCKNLQPREAPCLSSPE